MPRIQPLDNQDIAKDRILGVALQLFVRQGFSGTTTRQISEGCGITPGALYAHYESKEALFAALVSRYRRELAGGGHPIRQVLDETTFPDDIPALAAAIQVVVEEHKAYWLLWYVDVLEFEGKHFKSALAPQALLESPALKKRLAELSRSKRLRIEPGLAFTMVYMHLFNYFLVETVFGGRNHYGVPDEIAVAAITDIFLHGMLSPSLPRPNRSRR